MKRHGNLWPTITHPDTIAHAHRQAQRGKRHYQEVQMVNDNPDHYLTQLRDALLDRTFTTSPYQTSRRFDGRKTRTIHKLPYYPDRIVQHALLATVGPIWTRSFIRDTFQSIPGRGTSDAMRRVRQFVRATPNATHALKLDIEKYYPSVDNELLKRIVRRKIKCRDTLWLLDDIIDSAPGLPIGNYASQYLGNMYLTPFDWWVKQTVRPFGYFRYCDDIIVFAQSRKEARNLLTTLQDELAKYQLRVKPSWTIADVKQQGVNFVGFLFRPESTKLRASIAMRFRRSCRAARTTRLPDRAFNSLMAYKGWVNKVNAKMLWRTRTKPLRSVLGRHYWRSL